ncbi:VOC family protein [Chloroflexota bacterium]
MPYKFDHVGFVVKDIDEVAKLYKDILGITPWDRGVMEDKEHGVKLLLLQVGDFLVELIQPTAPGNRFAKFLDEHGEGLFHLSLFTRNYDKEVELLRDKGVPVEEEEIKDAFPGHIFKIAWLPPEATRGPWIELVDMTRLPEDIQ